jgi:hypothetical protein
MSQGPSVAIPHAWPIAQNLDTRSPPTVLTKDARIINGYVEKDPTDEKLWVYKRPGISTTPIAIEAAGTGIGSQGCYISPIGWLIHINAGVCYYSTYSGTVDSGSPYSFTPGAQNFTGYAGDVTSVVFHNASAGYVATINHYHVPTLFTLTQITDANFVSIATNQMLVPGFVEIDGTYYVMDLTGKIWASNLNDPTTWPVLNFILANNQSDLGVGIAKQLNYLVAFKQWGAQVFYNADNTTGSPLGVVSDAQIPYGCAHGGSIQNIDNDLLWLASNRNVAPQVVMLRNLGVRVVSTAAVDRILDGVLPNTNPEDNTIFSWVFKHGGHKFYGLSIVSLNLTLVYDITTDFWQIWQNASGSGVWPIYSIDGDSKTAQYYQDLPIASGLYAVDGDYEYPNDQGVLFPVDIYTKSEDFGIPRAKQLSAMYFLTDQVPGSILQARYSDDDYQSWSNFELVDLSVKKPRLGNQGTFEYRRAYHFRHQANTTFRLKPGYLQMDIGTL